MGGGQAQQPIQQPMAMPQQLPQITPEQAAQFPPEAVQELAQHAEQQNPSIIDQVSDFYARQPALVKGLGGAALVAILAKLSASQGQ